MSHLPPLAYSDLDGEQKLLFEEMNSFASEAFKDKFVYKGADGSLLGPFCPLLYTVDVARTFLSSLKSIGKLPGLPRSSREIAILATGSKWKALFEIYSHERMAILGTGLTQQQIDMVKTGRKPDGLDEQEETTFDVTVELMTRWDLYQKSCGSGQ